MGSSEAAGLGGSLVTTTAPARASARSRDPTTPPRGGVASGAAEGESWRAEWQLAHGQVSPPLPWSQRRRRLGCEAAAASRAADPR